MRVKEIRHNGNTMWADTAYIVATPVVSCTNNVVTMTCSTSGATIRYSTDGGSSWSNYSSSITISATTTYKAYATKSGMIDSGITTYTATYMQTVATPVVSCTNNVVTMTCSTSGATIRYSTDGGSSWSNYSTSITISATTTYKAYATKSGMIDSGITTYTATYMQKVATPVVSCTNNVVTMTCSTSGATIRYSTNGGSTWQTYSSSITISATTTYKAYATKSGMIDSAQTSYTATYVKPKLPTPTITAKTNNMGYWYFTVKTAGVSGVKYYLKYSTSPYGSVACSSVDTPTTSSYHATGTGTGSDSTWTYTTSYPLSYDINAKVIGTKSGYTNSDSKCAV